jgi:hypothetical protein
MDDNRDSLRVEYSEVGSHIRSYATMRFARLSLFSVVTAGLFAVTYQKVGDVAGDIRCLLKFLGAALAIAFIFMDRSGVWYWHSLTSRARQIEVVLGLATWRELDTRLPRRRIETVLRETNTTEALIGVVGLLWLTSAIFQVAG